MTAGKWQIEITSVAEKQLNRLDRKAAERIRTYIRETVASSDDPRRLARKVAGVEGVWRFRVGEYRILTKIDDGRLCILILILQVGGRGGIYRRIRE